MSEELGEFTGLCLPGMGPGRAVSLHVGSFSGGRLRGRCVQISLGDSFIQFDREGVAALNAVLSSWLRGEVP